MIVVASLVTIFSKALTALLNTQGRRRENWVGQAIDYNVEIATVYMPMREELLHSV